MTYKRSEPSWRKARSGKKLSGQPILANSRTYHGLRVSVQVALITTIKTGHSERARPAQIIHRVSVVSRAGIAMELIDSLLWLRPLNQLQAVACRIDGDANDDAGFAVGAGIAGHRAAGSLDGGDRRRHVLHVEDHVRD